MIEHKQPQLARETQTAGLTLADRVPKESWRSHAGGLKRDDARDRQKFARVGFAREALESTRKEQSRQHVVRWFGHGGGASCPSGDPLGPAVTRGAPGSGVPGAASSRPLGMSGLALSGLSGERLAAAISVGLTLRGW